MLVLGIIRRAGDSSLGLCAGSPEVAKVRKPFENKKIDRPESLFVKSFARLIRKVCNYITEGD